jgi:hypothetical protein
MNARQLPSQPSDDALDEAFAAARRRAVPAGPADGLVAKSKAALEQISQADRATVKPSQKLTRARRQGRYWAIACAACAAMWVGVMLWAPQASSAALFSKAAEKFSRFQSLQMQVVRMTDGQFVEEGMLYFQGSTWSHFAKNHGRRGDPDPAALPFIGAIINDLAAPRFLSINFADRTYSWLDDFQPEEPIPSRLDKFARSMDEVVMHLGSEMLGEIKTGFMSQTSTSCWVD